MAGPTVARSAWVVLPRGRRLPTKVEVEREGTFESKSRRPEELLFRPTGKLGDDAAEALYEQHMRSYGQAGMMRGQDLRGNGRGRPRYDDDSD